MNESFVFSKAQKFDSKARIALAGPSGSGKTMTALALAKALGKRVAVLDTEHGSAAKYSDVFDFDTLALNPPFSVDRFVGAIDAAEAASYDVLVIDSLSHAWAGAGGILEYVDTRGATKAGGSYAAWADGTKAQNRLIERILAAKMHVIVTMRSKMAYSQEKEEKAGKTVTVIKKLGLQPVQRDGVEYEFDVYADMTVPENLMVVTKSRCPGLVDKAFERPKGDEVAAILIPWLSGKEPPRVKPWYEQPGQLAKFLTIVGLSAPEALGRLGMTSFAEWPLTAQALAAALKAKVPEGKTWLDVPELSDAVEAVLRMTINEACFTIGVNPDEVTDTPAEFVKAVKAVAVAVNIPDDAWEKMSPEEKMNACLAPGLATLDAEGKVTKGA